MFENADALRSPPRGVVRPAEGGFPIFKEKPRIVYDRKKGKPPRDLEGGMSGYWFVSERLKQIFEQADPQGFMFAECDFILPDGSTGPTHYLCDIARKIDALDLERSKLKILNYKEAPGVQYYSIGEYGGRPELRFDEDMVGSAHVFTQPRLGAGPICDSTIRDSCKKCLDLKGVRFRRADKL
ncbi:DUF1629 domain-containing protein [Rhizobium leguminosarum]|nr:DUF1629 domain-containing protein [Rhizobium leguminosarum]